MLRDYQKQIIDQVKNYNDPSGKYCIQLPTGTGKSVIAKHYVDEEIKPGGKVLVIVPNCSLVDNMKRYLNDDATTIHAGVTPDLTKPIVISTYMSVKKLLGYGVFFPTLVIVDECHHVSAHCLKELFNNQLKDIKVIGLTATPNRTDGSGIGYLFKYLIESPAMKYFIDNGYLADYIVYVPINERTNYKKFDTNLNKLISYVPDISVTYDLWDKKSNKTGGTILFCRSVAHSKESCKYFQSKGIAATHLDGTMDYETRRSLLNDFNLCKIKVLSNVNCLSEGVDCKNVSCIILNTFTKSQIMFMQMIGRGLRPDYQGKILTIIDAGHNFTHHGDCKAKKYWNINTNNKDSLQQKPGNYHCSYCQTLLAKKSELWPAQMVEHPLFATFTKKDICCINKNCQGYGLLVSTFVYKNNKGNTKLDNLIANEFSSYDQLDLDLVELTSLIRRKLPNFIKCELITMLPIPKPLVEKSLKIVLGNSASAKLKIKSYLSGL